MAAPCAPRHCVAMVASRRHFNNAFPGPRPRRELVRAGQPNYGAWKISAFYRVGMRDLGRDWLEHLHRWTGLDEIYRAEISQEMTKKLSPEGATFC